MPGAKPIGQAPFGRRRPDDPGKIAATTPSAITRQGHVDARFFDKGAAAAFAGKAFPWSLGALGERGPAHLIDLLIDELSATLGQLGCLTVADLRSVPVRHPGAYRAADFAARPEPGT